MLDEKEGWWTHTSPLKNSWLEAYFRLRNGPFLGGDIRSLSREYMKPFLGQVLSSSVGFKVTFSGRDSQKIQNLWLLSKIWVKSDRLCAWQMSPPQKRLWIVAEIPHISGVDKGNVKSRICVALTQFVRADQWFLFINIGTTFGAYPRALLNKSFYLRPLEEFIGKDFKWFVSTCSWCDANDGASIKPNGQTTTKGFSMVIDPRMRHHVLLYIICARIWPPLYKQVTIFHRHFAVWGLKISDSNTMRFGNRTSRLG